MSTGVASVSPADDVDAALAVGTAWPAACTHRGERAVFSLTPCRAQRNLGAGGWLGVGRQLEVEIERMARSTVPPRPDGNQGAGVA